MKFSIAHSDYFVVLLDVIYFVRNENLKKNWKKSKFHCYFMKRDYLIVFL